MRRLMLMLVLVCALAMAVASPAFAHRWDIWDPSNEGRAAKLYNDLDYMRGVHEDVRLQMNDLAGTRGVLFNPTGEPGDPGLSFEVKVRDVALSNSGGNTQNLFYCYSADCYDYSIITIDNDYKDAPDNWKHMIFRHEYAHSLGAQHEACGHRDDSIMVGPPDCPEYILDIFNFGSHDLDNYAYNRKVGYYDEGPNTLDGPRPRFAGAPYLTEDTLNESNVVQYVKQHSPDADKIKVTHPDGGTLVSAKYIEPSLARHKTH